MTRAGRQPTMADRARRIVAHHLGARVNRVEAVGGGLTNHVFRVRVTGGTVIVRLGETGGKTEAFLKEQWVVARAGEAGVPVVRILQVGSEVIDTPYMILEQAGGLPGPKIEDRLGLLRQLGETAARLHAVATQGYGETFDWSANTLSRCPDFAALLDRLEARERIDRLRKLGAIDRARQAMLSDALADAAADKAPARLNHGDLRLKNLFAGADGAIRAVIDWEDSISAPPRLWDLPLALHDLGPDEAEAFLQGYGLSPRETLALKPAWAAMNAVHYAPFVAAAAGDAARTAWFRARLMGAFDRFTP